MKIRSILIGIILAVYLEIELPKGFEYLDGLPVLEKQECVIMHFLKGECVKVKNKDNRIYSITIYKKLVLSIHEEGLNGSIELYPERKFIL